MTGLSGAILATFTGGVFVAAWAGTWALLPLLRRLGAVATPNARSSHEHPTPTGGGIAPVLAVCVAWAAAPLVPGLALDGGAMAIVVLAALALAAVSWVDDLRGLGPATRLAAHFLAAGVGVLALPGPVFQGLLPLWADAALAVLAWVWFVNLFNFMDGIDGIACAELAAVAIGVALVAMLAAVGGAPVLLAMTLAAAALAFLLWNWHPARVFLGDAGVVPLAFLLGWVLLALAAAGQWAAAAILPLVFVGDATLTLCRRLLRREPVWIAHRGHFYQHAANRRGHAPVTVAVSVTNVGLALLAALSAVSPPLAAFALAAAALLVAALLWYFHRP